MTNNYYQKHKEKLQKEARDVKFFLKKKKTKDKKKERYQIFSEEGKEKRCNIIRIFLRNKIKS